jgi:hypothetical protein
MDRYNRTDGTMQITCRLTPTAITALSGRMYSTCRRCRRCRRGSTSQLCSTPALCQKKKYLIQYFLHIISTISSISSISSLTEQINRPTGGRG